MIFFKKDFSFFPVYDIIDTLYINTTYIDKRATKPCVAILAQRKHNRGKDSKHIMNALTYIAETVTDTEKLGARLASTLCGQSFIALYGTLGMGKTAFVRGMASVLCPNAPVQSPTYTVINEYKNNGKTVLVHVDAYRIKDDDDLYSTGFYDCVEEDERVTAVEWSENIPFAIPNNAIRVTLEPYGDGGRKITVEGAPRPL